MLGKLHSLPQALKLLPFVRMSHAAPSQYHCQDDAGQIHIIEQREGSEQGDPLMPILFSLGIHDVPEEINRSLSSNELIFAYLDDIYVIAKPGRLRAIYELLAGALEQRTSIRANVSKIKILNKKNIWSIFAAQYLSCI